MEHRPQRQAQDRWFKNWKNQQLGKLLVEGENHVVVLTSDEHAWVWPRCDCYEEA